MIELFDALIDMEIAHRAGDATSAEFDALWATLPVTRIDEFQTYREDKLINA